MWAVEDRWERLDPIPGEGLDDGLISPACRRDQGAETEAGTGGQGGDCDGQRSSSRPVKTGQTGFVSVSTGGGKRHVRSLFILPRRVQRWAPVIDRPQSHRRIYVNRTAKCRA